ncbi:acyl carrier protein [Fimicolochytrium jonesii]|uniref:acyl carrier protein n=1 Tax=Fimicolochytrium jonesii TaxID=1396493 RepID=UPI0022FE539C|nr:acyl carrier protein [Fimicolochytrium jonesii]KAI8815953.1 acyl carrier protein [Fimicolochytrium jonesii]
MSSAIFRFASRAAASRSAISRLAQPQQLHRAVARPMLAALPVRFFSAEKAPLTPQQVEDRVLQLLRDFDKVDASKLSLDAHFINDLGLDSLDQVEITMALEDEFNIEIPDRDAEEILTPRQAADKIFSNKNAM